nr:PREDICTED: methyltransferase-like protein 8 isoform X2 [Latimeria chalumnae]|eukprot:XP_014348172.1 PREDICTED: methyltransferase-like protein 8 isoform X2 [Latimeria chalumnae]
MKMNLRTQVRLAQNLSALLQKKTDLQNRFLSSGRPTAPLGSRLLTDPSRVFEHNMWSYSKSFLYCCDFSSEAVSLVKLHPFYNAASSYAFVHDVCDEALTFPFPDESINIILLVFVLSPIHPDRMQWVVHRLAKLLKPGGMLLFRDYGRYNLSQLRFKKGRCLFENWYVRGGGTRVYFFTKELIGIVYCGWQEP